MKPFCKDCIYKSLPNRRRDFKENETLFHEGDEITNVYRIVSGFVKVHKYLENGDERILSILGPGEYIALIAVLQNNFEYLASATTLTNTILVAIDKDDVSEAYNKSQTFRESCLNCAITRTSFFQFQYSHSANLDLEDKIMNMLKNLKNKFSFQDNVLALPFTKTVLANIIGIRRETLSRYLKLLQDKKQLKVDKNMYYFL
jgi:CRP/FNR family transcriptional regulator